MKRLLLRWLYLALVKLNGQQRTDWVMSQWIAEQDITPDEVTLIWDWLKGVE